MIQSITYKVVLNKKEKGLVNMLDTINYLVAVGEITELLVKGAGEQC